MSNEIQSIHEFDFDFICEYFSNFERQGPGSEESTLMALSFIDNLNAASRIADLGCGTGGQTMTLAQHAPGMITGIDLFPRFIELFNRNAEKLNLSERVKGEVGSMDDLHYREEELDLIWSEGAIYNIGFERGVNEWRKYLKKGAYLAVTEACWLTRERPEEINHFWMTEYPEIDTIPRKMAQIQDAGYLPVASFVLPERCWTDNFFAPQHAIQEKYMRERGDEETVRSFIANMRHEAQLYAKYKEYYGYVFFIGKKI